MSKAQKGNASAFDTWFHAQFGPREAAGATDTQLRDSCRAGDAARTELAQRAVWDASRKAALYAWATKERK